MQALVGNTKPTIKPDDLVRTPSGRTAVVIQVRPCGFRLLQYVDAPRGQVELHVDDLYLVRSAVPRPWPGYRL
jgi:hypothetical protein